MCLFLTHPLFLYITRYRKASHALLLPQTHEYSRQVLLLGDCLQHRKEVAPSLLPPNIQQYHRLFDSVLATSSPLLSSLRYRNSSGQSGSCWFCHQWLQHSSWHRCHRDDSLCASNMRYSTSCDTRCNTDWEWMSPWNCQNTVLG